MAIVVDLPSYEMVIFHSYVNVYHRVDNVYTINHRTHLCWYFSQLTLW